MSRRAFLSQSAWGAAALTVLGLPHDAAWPFALRRAGIKIGGCDWSMGREGKLESFALAKEAGLDGVQVSLGSGKEKLPMCDPEKQKTFAEESKKTEMPIGSTCLEILHRDDLKVHADGPKWVEQSIAATAAPGAKVVLLPFFGRHAIEKREEQKKVAERLKALAPVAEKMKVFGRCEASACYSIWPGSSGNMARHGFTGVSIAQPPTVFFRSGGEFIRASFSEALY